MNVIIGHFMLYADYPFGIYTFRYQSKRAINRKFNKVSTDMCLLCTCLL